MAENNQTPEPERYQHAVVAAQFLQAKDVRSAGKSLEKLARDMGADDDLLPLMRGTLENPRYLQEAIMNCVGKYEKALGNKQVRDLFTRYESFFDEYMKGEERKLAQKAFEKNGNETYANVREKMEKAKEIVDSETGNFSDERKKDAKKTIKKYSQVYNTIIEFDLIRTQELMEPILKESIRERLQERFKKEE